MKCEICGSADFDKTVVIAQTKTTIDICSVCARHVTDLTYSTGSCVVNATEFDLEDWIQKNPYTDISAASEAFKAAVEIYS